uniref:Uncharacterized protein n=1 Tax=Micrurus lemniscatus lemniscatus TaxID=129467 RepID=A0A2D4JLQ6_MICLE
MEKKAIMIGFWPRWELKIGRKIYQSRSVLIVIQTDRHYIYPRLKPRKGLLHLASFQVAHAWHNGEIVVTCDDLGMFNFKLGCIHRISIRNPLVSDFCCFFLEKHRQDFGFNSYLIISGNFLKTFVIFNFLSSCFDILLFHSLVLFKTCLSFCFYTYSNPFWLGLIF